MRYTAGFSIFYATLSLVLVNLVNRIIKNPDFKTGLVDWYNQTIVGLQKGAINMVAAVSYTHLTLPTICSV